MLFFSKNIWQHQYWQCREGQVDAAPGLEEARLKVAELTDQESGRLAEHRSAGEEREEQAMVDLAIKVRLQCSILVFIRTR